MPPNITCPESITVSVSHWDDDSIVVHYDAQRPEVSDNSGRVNYTVNGVPSNKRFSIGLSQLKYTAYDESGNSAFCTQSITVKGRSLCSVHHDWSIHEYSSVLIWSNELPFYNESLLLFHLMSPMAMHEVLDKIITFKLKRIETHEHLFK